MDSNNLSGNVAIVTGASSGIGLATAKLLAGQGVNVALVSRSKEKLEKISSELPGSLAVPADMTKIPQITRMIKKTKEHQAVKQPSTHMKIPYLLFEPISPQRMNNDICEKRNPS